MSLARLPFRRLDTQQRLRLVWTGLAIFYVLFTCGAIWAGRLFDYTGGDYRVFRASAQIALARGFSHLYDLDLQEQFQRPLYDRYSFGPNRTPYETAPLYYLPVFVLPMLVLAPWGPLPGFIFWTVLNAALLLWYLWRFTRAVGAAPSSTPWLPVLFSAPMFGILFFGQVNVWLLIAMGELVLSWRQEKELQGGLWLALFLLKPQSLVLVLPALLVGRRFKTLAGFALGGTVLLGASCLLAGPQALVELGRLMLESSAGVATNNPQVMINWRSLAVNLLPVLPAPLAWGLAWVGMAATAVVALALWVRPGALASRRWTVALLGSWSASCAVAWHSHTNLALSTVPLLLLPEVRQRLSPAALEAWFLIPALVFPPVFFIRPDLAHNMVGLSLLGLNIYLVAWSAYTLWPQRRSAAGEGDFYAGNSPPGAPTPS